MRAWDLASAYDESNDPDYTVGLLMGHDAETQIFYIIKRSPRQRSSTTVLANIRIPQEPGGAGKFEAHHLAGLLQGYIVSNRA